MPYKFIGSETSVLGPGKYKNAKGHTECVAFIQAVTKAPTTALWKRGIKVTGAKPNAIARDTVIATFDDKGKYPTDHMGMHAAIYLSQNPQGIRVLDQWNKQGEVKPRTIYFNQPKGTTRSNDGDTFYVVE